MKIEISIEENNFNWKLKFQLNSTFKSDTTENDWFHSKDAHLLRKSQKENFLIFRKELLIFKFWIWQPWSLTSLEFFTTSPSSGIRGFFMDSGSQGSWTGLKKKERWKENRTWFSGFQNILQLINKIRNSRNAYMNSLSIF